MNDAVETKQEQPQEVEASAVDAVVMLPAAPNGKRVETGPVQFGDDWPGVFMRGDYAGPMAMYLRGALEIMECNDPLNAIEQAALKGLVETLESCRAT